MNYLSLRGKNNKKSNGKNLSTLLRGLGFAKMPASFNSFSFLNSSCFRKSSALRSTSYIGGKKDKSANNADTPYTHPAVTIRSSKCISSGKKNKKQYFDSYASTQLIVLNRTWAQRPHQVGIPRPPAPSTSPPPGS